MHRFYLLFLLKLQLTLNNFQTFLLLLRSGLLCCCSWLFILWNLIGYLCLSIWVISCWWMLFLNSLYHSLCSSKFFSFSQLFFHVSTTFRAVHVFCKILEYGQKLGILKSFGKTFFFNIIYLLLHFWVTHWLLK